MPIMSNVYQIVLHRIPYAHEPFYWETSEPFEITAMNEHTARRLALRTNDVGDPDRWVVKSCANLGAWNRQP